MLCLEERRLLVLKKGIIRKIGSNFLAGPVAIGDEVAALNYKRLYKEECFYDEGCKILVQVAQKDLKYPIPEDIQGQFRQGSQLFDLAENVPCPLQEVVGLDDL